MGRGGGKVRMTMRYSIKGSRPAPGDAEYKPPPPPHNRLHRCPVCKHLARQHDENGNCKKATCRCRGAVLVR